MPQLGDFLNRFRPAGAPGAATRAGVPADRAAELSDELGPVLAKLAGADAECARLIDEAEQAASQISRQASERAADIAADAVRAADAARAAAAAEQLALARERATQAERTVAAEVAARPGPAEADVQALITAAVDLVWNMAEGTGTP